MPVGQLQEPREYAAATAVDREFWAPRRAVVEGLCEVLGGGAHGRSSSVEVWDASYGWRYGPEMRPGLLFQQLSG